MVRIEFKVVANSIMNHLNYSQLIDILVYELRVDGRPTWMGYGSDGAWGKLPARPIVTFSVQQFPIVSFPYTWQISWCWVHHKRLGLLVGSDFLLPKFASVFL